MSGRGQRNDEGDQHRVKFVIVDEPSAPSPRAGPRYPELLATSSSDVLFEGTNDGVIEWLSDGVVNLLGRSPDEFVGTRFVNHLHPNDIPLARRVQAEVIAGRASRARLRVRTRADRWRWVDVSVKPVLDGNGTVIGRYGSWRDVQAEVGHEDALRQANELTHLMFSTMLDPIIVLRAVRTLDGHIVDFEYLDANDAACAYNGVAREELVGARILDLFPGLASTPVFDDYRSVVETGEPLVLDGWTYFNELYGGSERFYDVRAVRLGDGLFLTWRDVTDRITTLRELALGKEHYRLIADNSSDVIVHTRDERIVWASPSIEALTGIAAERWVGRDVSGFVFDDDRHIADAGAEAVARGESPVFRLRLTQPDGSCRWAELHPVTYYDSFGQPDGVITSVRFVDDLVRAQEELTHAAHHDAVTGMLNRHEVLNQLAGITTHPARTGTDVAVVFCDLDVFKPINDEHGHAAGDDVLRAVAERIRACIRADDLAARIGGDELLVVLPSVHSLEEATHLAEKIRDTVTGVITTRSGVEVVTTVSIGVTLAHPGESGDEMVQRADRAMYEAKRAGGNRVVAVA